MIPDALDALRVLRGRLGRDPSYAELLQELGHPPAGAPSAGPNDPGYPATPGLASALLGPVESDEGLTALLRSRDLREANPDLERLRAQLVHRLLYGDLPPLGPGMGDLLGVPTHGLGRGGHAQPAGLGPLSLS